MKFRTSIYQVWFDCPLFDYYGVLPSPCLTTLMIVFSPLLAVWLLIHSFHSCYCTGWFRQDSGVVWLTGDCHFTTLSNNIQHPNLIFPLSLVPPALSAQADKCLFPCQELLTASKSAKTPSKEKALFSSRWAKVAFTLSQSVICLHQLVFTGSCIHQRGSNDTIATQSTAWEKTSVDRSSN